MIKDRTNIDSKETQHRYEKFGNNQSKCKYCGTVRTYKLIANKMTVLYDGSPKYTPCSERREVLKESPAKKIKTEETIKEMLCIKKSNINIYENERRLILLAIIYSNYDLRKAFNINKPSHTSFDAYQKKFYRYGITLTRLQKEVEQIRREK